MFLRLKLECAMGSETASVDILIYSTPTCQD